MMITKVGEYSSRPYKEKRLHFCSLLCYSALSPIVFLILGASPSSIDMEESLHCQFPLAVPGVLILASFPSPSQSWIGTTIRKDLDFSPSWMILGGNKSGAIDILGMVTYMDWPVIMGKGLKTNQELIDAGIMFKADTIEGLAEKIGFPPETLAETVATYNQYCADGVDPEFGRGEEVYTNNLFNAVEGRDQILSLGG